MAGQDYRLIRVMSKKTFGDIVQQRRKPLWIIPGIAHTAREQGIPAEDQDRSAAIPKYEGNGARSVATQVYALENRRANEDLVPVAKRTIDLYRRAFQDPGGVFRAGESLDSRGVNHFLQRTDVVPVLVCRGNANQ